MLLNDIEILKVEKELEIHKNTDISRRNCDED